MKKYTLLLAFALPLLAFTLSSCGNKNKKTGPGAGQDMVTDTATIPGLDIQESSDTLTEGDIRGGEFLSQETVKTVNFDYDRYELSEESRATLQANAALIKARKDWTALLRLFVFLPTVTFIVYTLSYYPFISRNSF